MPTNNNNISLKKKALKYKSKKLEYKKQKLMYRKMKIKYMYDKEFCKDYILISSICRKKLYRRRYEYIQSE